MLGRFLQRDPLEIDDENTYTYCYNDPVNYIDPYGYQGMFEIPYWGPTGLGPTGVWKPKPDIWQPGGDVLPKPTVPGEFAPSNPKGISLGTEKSLTQQQGVSENVTHAATKGEKEKGEKDKDKDKDSKDKGKKPKPDSRTDKPPSKPHYDKKTGKKEPEHWHYRDYNWDPKKGEWKPGKWRYGGPGQAPF